MFKRDIVPKLPGLSLIWNDRLLPVRYSDRNDRELEEGSYPVSANDFARILRERDLVEVSKVEFGECWSDPTPDTLPGDLGTVITLRDRGSTALFPWYTEFDTNSEGPK